ncbi:MAG: SprT-like domain-containing protein [Cyanobacteria bacterium P01_F01_bin.143]
MIRITGIVKTANQVRTQLQQGISPQEVDSLKKFVANSLKTIEKICTEANTKPDYLPTPSRKAYYYLKTIDWHNLPIANQTSNIITTKTLSIKNIVKQQKNIQQQFRQISLDYTSTEIREITQKLTNWAQDVECICQNNNVTPAALTTPSRKAYAWIKFLTDKNNLKLHLNTIKKITQLAQKTIKAQKLDIREVEVSITNISGLYKYKKNRQGNIELQLSEGFIQANKKILQAIVRMILLGKNSRDTQLIRDFGLTEEYSNVILELDLIADLDAETPQGNCYDLEQLFHRINQEYFAGKMAKPRLTWNKTLTHRKLGHYEPLRDRVVMSRTLDSSKVPQIVVELVLYHELLHKHHGMKWVNGRCMVHTPEFRRSEKKFKYYQEAQQWIDNFSISSL